MSNRAAGASTMNGGESCLDGVVTGMARSLLTEIAEQLQALSQTGRSSAINLRGLPMTEADRAQLDEYLGRGEVTATLDLSGASEVWETRYPGIWRIRHRGLGGQIVSEEIAVTPIPDILKTHPEDIRSAAGRLSADLGSLEGRSDRHDRQPGNDTEAPNVR